MDSLKQIVADAYHQREALMWIALHLAAGAFILAWLGVWVRDGVKKWRITRGHREAQKQLKEMTEARGRALTHRVVSERRKDAA